MIPVGTRFLMGEQRHLRENSFQDNIMAVAMIGHPLGLPPWASLELTFWAFGLTNTRRASNNPNNICLYLLSKLKQSVTKFQMILPNHTTKAHGHSLSLLEIPFTSIIHATSNSILEKISS